MILHSPDISPIEFLLLYFWISAPHCLEELEQRAYQTGWHAGRPQGFSDGLEAGRREGYARGFQEGKLAGYLEGLEQGKESGKLDAETAQLKTENRRLKAESGLMDLEIVPSDL